jgi:hypothetical protein
MPIEKEIPKTFVVEDAYEEFMKGVGLRDRPIPSSQERFAKDVYYSATTQLFTFFTKRIGQMPVAEAEEAIKKINKDLIIFMEERTEDMFVELLFKRKK